MRAFTVSDDTTSRTRFVAELSDTTIIRFVASRRVIFVPSANSVSTPEPGTFFSLVRTSS